LDRLGPPLLRRSLEMRAQVGAALLHLVAQFASGKGGEGGIAELLPGGIAAGRGYRNRASQAGSFRRNLKT
jgi:hypothetical protein